MRKRRESEKAAEKAAEKTQDGTLAGHAYYRNRFSTSSGAAA